MVHRYLDNSADPDETPRFAASHLCLRYLLIVPFFLFLCIIHVYKFAYIDFRQTTPLEALSLHNGLLNGTAEINGVQPQE